MNTDASRDANRPDDAAAAIRAADRLANERTFLAWIRTSLSLVTFGFVIAKFSVWLRQFTTTLRTVNPEVRVPRPGASLPAGLALMAFGGILAWAALRRHQAVDRALAEGRFPDAQRLAGVVAGVVVIVAVALIVFLLATSLAF